MTQIPPSDEPQMDVIEPIVQRTALVVWVGRDKAGNVEGTVERARTGEKERFQGLDGLAQVIARMAEHGHDAR